MYRLSYQVTALADLVITRKGGDQNTVGTRKDLPGATILGVLAARFRQKKSLSQAKAYEDPCFFNWFLKGGLIFTPAYLRFKDERRTRDYLPIPLSIHKKKHTSEMLDLLFGDEDSLNNEIAGPLDTFGVLSQDLLYARDVETAFHFHHARDREKGRPLTGGIFNYEAIKRGQMFAGDILGPEEDLKALLTICGQKWEAVAGRSKSAEYGQVTVELEGTPTEIEAPDFYDDEISLTLVSDTIIYNELGMATTDREDLQPYLKGAEIKNAFVKKEEAEQFVGVWGLKTPSQACLKAGSTFLLDTSDMTEEKKAELMNLQITGIGDQTGEGYGRCVFGLQEETDLTLKNVEPPGPDKPEEPMPEGAQAVVHSIIRKMLIEAAEKTAMDDCWQFRNRPPTRSLQGRLEAMATNFGKRLPEAMKMLNEPALEQLRTCRNEDRKDLLTFITLKKMSTRKILNHNAQRDLKELCDEIGYHAAPNNDLDGELYTRYFKTLFTMMRKSVERD